MSPLPHRNGRTRNRLKTTPAADAIVARILKDLGLTPVGWQVGKAVKSVAGRNNRTATSKLMNDAINERLGIGSGKRKSPDVGQRGYIRCFGRDRGSSSGRYPQGVRIIMPKIRDILVHVSAEEAQRQGKCRRNTEHIIAKGERCLVVKTIHERRQQLLHRPRQSDA
jgi:hypothetical protein